MRNSFEFASNEFMNDMASVTLETASTETGLKDFIVVGTTINRGEDLAAKGAVSSKKFLGSKNLSSHFFRPMFLKLLKWCQTLSFHLSVVLSSAYIVEMKPKVRLLRSAASLAM